MNDGRYDTRYDGMSLWMVQWDSGLQDRHYEELRGLEGLDEVRADDAFTTYRLSE